MTDNEDKPTPEFRYVLAYTNTRGERRTFLWTTAKQPLGDREVVTKAGHRPVTVVCIVAPAEPKLGPDEPGTTEDVEAELYFGSLPASDGP